MTTKKKGSISANILDVWGRFLGPRRDGQGRSDGEYEFCPRCGADLTLQKGYDNSLPYWICKGCGEMLMNPELDDGSGILWRCDKCESVLNTQPGFREDCGEWTCLTCGHVNKISESEVFESDDEYQASKLDPYKGLPDEAVLALSMYELVGAVGGRGNIFTVRHRETGSLYIEKLLTAYDRSIYDYLGENPIEHMPRIAELYESSNCLIVLEEYVEGETVAERLGRAPFSEEEAVRAARDICVILDRLHNLPRPIIHRDVKPSNIMLTPEGEVVLLDMNAAKWYGPGRSDDTNYMGTWFYAAPEQAGFGLSASSPKTDTYALGVTLNVMLTGQIPKEKKAGGRIWDVIERCISLNAEERYSAAELIRELDRIMEEKRWN